MHDDLAARLRDALSAEPDLAAALRSIQDAFGAQIGTAPPTFALSINHPVDLHFSYLRYVENQIRERFGFEGTPIVLKVRFRRH